MSVFQRRIVRIAASFLLAACGACASMSVTVKPLTQEKYPATEPQSLKLHNRKPPGEWVDIVRIEITGTDSDGFEDARERARREAAQLGAEALWIYGERMESRSSYVPPTSFSWTETRSGGFTGNYKYRVEHTTTTPGRTVRYAAPVCTYVGIRRSGRPAPDDSGAPTFACPKCSTPWQCPPQDDVYECTCSQYMYVLSCPGCRKRFVWSRAGDDACPACKIAVAVLLCPHCNHAHTGERYVGEHRCAFCQKQYWGIVCAGCRKTLVSKESLARAECPECGRQFDVSPGTKRVPTRAKAYLGLSIQDLPAEECNRLMVPVGEAVVAVEILEGSPAAGSGLRVGDVITRIEDDQGERWNGDFADYLDWIQSRPVGSTVTITFLREQKTLRARAVLDESK